MAQLLAPVKEQFLREYLALVEAGATPDEAVTQVAQTNEVEVSEVEAQ